MSSTTATLWDEVWAEYDARQAPAPVIRARAMPNRAAPGRAVAGARATRQSRLGWWPAALLALGLAVYAAAPVLASQQVTDALDADDPEALAALVDWPMVRAGLVGELSAAAHALPPGRTAGLSGAGLDYLQAMAREIAAGMASTDGLAELMRRRLGLEAGARLAAAQVQPQGLTRARMVLAAADGSDGSVAMTLALTDPLRLRWQVVAVDISD